VQRTELLRRQLPKPPPPPPSKPPDKTAPQKQQHECSVCFSDVQFGRGRSCTNGHWVCNTCLVRLVEGSASRSPIELSPEEREAHEYRVYCPLRGHGCDCSTKLIGALSADSGSPLAKESLSARRAVRCLQTAQKMLSELDMTKDLTEQQVLEAGVRLQFRKADGSFSAYMCKRCKHGPVEHSKCSALMTHHVESRGWGSRVNNRCPKCGWLANSIAEWPAWDGVFRGDTGGYSLHRAAAQCKDAAIVVSKTKTFQVTATASAALVAAPFVVAALPVVAAVSYHKRRRRNARMRTYRGGALFQDAARRNRNFDADTQQAIQLSLELSRQVAQPTGDYDTEEDEHQVRELLQQLRY